MTQNQNLFFQKFGITPGDLQRYLAEALSAGGDYADLYFEYLTSTSISVDESIVKSASQGISAGCGVRVLAGERQRRERGQPEVGGLHQHASGAVQRAEHHQPDERAPEVRATPPTRRTRT